MSRTLVALGLAALVAGCSSGTGPSAEGTVSLSFTTRPASGVQLNRAAALDDTIATGGDTLIVTSAQIVLRQIELKLQDNGGCQALGPNDADGCEEFSTGTMLMDLPLNGEVATEITIAPAPGTYDEVDFEVHKPENGGADSAFLAQHPDFAGVSIRVEGTYNGQPFTYETDLDVEQENALVPPLVISDTTTAANVTMLVDIATWFRTAGGSIIDPASANQGGQNESVVNENIKQSFHSFKDDDRDGDGTDETNG
jgi:hypothetical protein